MNKLLQWTILIGLIATAHCTSTRKEDRKSEVKFYAREFGAGSDNGKAADTTYFDDLVITNYMDGDFTINELYKMATSYIDTANADKHISMVTFLGQEPRTELPYPSSIGCADEDRIASFGFLQDSSNSAKKIDNLTTIAIPGDDGWFQIYWTEIAEDRKVIDSLLKSKTKFHR